ncbi:MAG: hypothetical protein E7613_02155 [Ruminococcaceae bacterium]|nr:hypothetical protein [Oscillospiraceae bacterium]
MGKFIEEAWTAYQEKNHTEKLNYEIIICCSTIEKLAEELSEDKFSKVKESLNSLVDIYSDFEKKAFIEGLHTMLDRI